MNFYSIFILFLYIEGYNTRVVPLNFKTDESKNVDSGNELIDESPFDNVEILDHSLPDKKQSSDLELLVSKDKNASFLEIPIINASSFTEELEFKEKDVDKELNFESTVPLVISNHPVEEFNSTSDITGKRTSDSKAPLETLLVNGTLNNQAVDNLTMKSEDLGKNGSSSLGLEEDINIEFNENLEKLMNDTLHQQNETSATFEVFNGTTNADSSQLQPVSNDSEDQVSMNDTENTTNHHNESSVMFTFSNGTNNTADSFQLLPISNKTEVEVFLSDTKNITEKSDSAMEDLNKTNDSEKESGAIFSGFNFLINSEVAKNAAKAMEVFNFSDPLTDHIIEENEFHSFLPAFNAEESLETESETQLKPETLQNSSSESIGIEDNLNTSITFTKETSTVTKQVDPEEVLKADTLEIKNNSSIPMTLNQTLEIRNKTEEFKLNTTAEISPLFENSSETIQFSSEVTTSITNDFISNSTAVGSRECPPPGWCIFWFLSQDTCAVNEHCLGSRICCKIGCSKTCIEV